MILFDKLRENADAIRQVGAIAREKARAAGVPSYYMDPALGEGIIKEMPDGTRHRIEPSDGGDVVVESFRYRGWGRGRLHRRLHHPGRSQRVREIQQS